MPESEANTSTLKHKVVGGAVAFGLVAIFVGGMVTEATLGMSRANASTTPTTALAADHSTTSTTAGK